MVRLASNLSKAMVSFFFVPLPNRRTTLTNNTGPGHFVITADFDNDGIDEFLVALWGPSPEDTADRPASECQGVWYYKSVDLPNGIFAKWKVATDSAARIAVGYCALDDLLLMI